MKAALRMEGVRKSYGRVRALDGLDLVVPLGSTTGLVGPNGAGKTTAFAVVAGTVRPDAGTVDVLGEGPYRPDRMAGRLGVLPQDSALSPHMPIRDLLGWLGRLQGLDRREALREADRVLDLVGLAERAGQRTRQLSHGMRRRVAVAQALLGDPELVLLDEPTAGLDPALVVHMRAVLRASAANRTLVISSHQLTELEATCDHVIFMERGRQVHAGSMAEVTGHRDTLRIHLARPPDLGALQARCPGLSLRLEDEVLVVTGGPDDDPAVINRRLLPVLLEQGADILEVRRGEGLEAAWLRRVQGRRGA